MKIHNQHTDEYQPVTVTFETEEEAAVVLALIGATSVLDTGDLLAHMGRSSKAEVTDKAMFALYEVLKDASTTLSKYDHLIAAFVNVEVEAP